MTWDHEIARHDRLLMSAKAAGEAFQRTKHLPRPSWREKDHEYHDTPDPNCGLCREANLLDVDHFEAELERRR